MTVVCYWIAGLLVFCFLACGGAKTAPQTGRSASPDDSRATALADSRMKLSSPAFADGANIPRRYTGDGEDISPELNWDGVPEGVASFALICSDPDAPLGTFIHWVVYNIPQDARRLPEGLPAKEVFDDGMIQGVNSFQRIGYDGPKPPPGKPHRYFFRLYALDCVLNLKPGASAGKLQEAMSGHILAEAELMGLYGR